MKTKLAKDEYGAGSATAMPRVTEIVFSTSFRPGAGNNGWSLA